MMAPASATVYSSRPLWYMEPVATAPRNITKATNVQECRTNCGEAPSCTHFQFKDNQCAWYAGKPELEYNNTLKRMTSVHQIKR